MALTLNSLWMRFSDIKAINISWAKLLIYLMIEYSWSVVQKISPVKSHLILCLKWSSTSKLTCMRWFRNKTCLYPELPLDALFIRIIHRYLSVEVQLMSLRLPSNVKDILLIKMLGRDSQILMKPNFHKVFASSITEVLCFLSVVFWKQANNNTSQLKR